MLKKSIIFFGGLDLFLILWISIRDFANSKIPVFDSLVEAIKASINFGLTTEFFIFVNVLSSIVMLSLVVSGWLMILSKKTGIYISFAQAPFRLLLIQPTFFFLVTIGVSLNINSNFLIAFVLLLEAVKIYTQYLWLKRRSKQEQLAVHMV